MAVDPTQLSGLEGGPLEARRTTRDRRRRAGRVLSYLVTLWVLVTINFFLPRAMPGDPISLLVASGGVDARADDADVAAAVRYYGLDRPLLHQYGRYLSGLARGDLGQSIRENRPVRSVLGDRLPWTVLLGCTAVVLATLAGLVAGVHSGWRRGGRLDRALLGLFVAMRGVPPFFLASLAVFVFAVQLGWFPLGGATTAFSQASGLSRLADIAHHLALPATIMAMVFAGGPYLIMRAGMVRELGADYLLGARAKGTSQRRLKYAYAARNAALPVVTLTAVEFSLAVSGGLVFVETVFAYPGVGRLMFESATYRDYPTLQGGFLVLSAMVVTTNFVADALYARLDPRTR